MPPKKRGGPVRPVIKGYGNPAGPGGQPVPSSTPASLKAALEATPESASEEPLEDALTAEDAPAESPAGAAAIEQKISPIHQQPAYAAEPPPEGDSPAVTVFATPVPEIPVPEIPTNDLVEGITADATVTSPSPSIEEHAAADIMDDNTGNAPLAPLDEVVSTSASLIGSVAGGIGLASIIGGGLVVIGLGAAVGAWYSVALANNYLTRRWGTGNKGAA
jgi:hypothetical protein